MTASMKTGFVLSALLLAAAAALFWQARQSDPESYRRAGDDVRQIRQLATEWSVETARARSDTMGDYDALAAFIPEVARLKESLLSFVRDSATHAGTSRQRRLRVHQRAGGQGGAHRALQDRQLGDPQFGSLPAERRREHRPGRAGPGSGGRRRGARGRPRTLCRLAHGRGQGTSEGAIVDRLDGRRGRDARRPGGRVRELSHPTPASCSTGRDRPSRSSARPPPAR